MTAIRATVLQADFVPAINAVMKAIDSRAATPALSCIYIEVYDKGLRLTATNIKEVITVAINADVKEVGTALLPAKTLHGLVGLMSKESIELSMDAETETMALRCGKTASTIKGIKPEEYPDIKVSNNKKSICLPGAVFKEIAKEVVFAAAKEDNRPTLTGILIKVDEKTRAVTFAAADGYRLTARTVNIIEDVPVSAAEFIVPRQAFLDMMQLADSDDVTIFYPSDKGNTPTVTLHQRSMQISAAAILGRYPDFAAIIPKKHNSTITIDREEWLKKCGVAEVFARDDAYSVKLAAGATKANGEDAILALSGRSAERGHAAAKVDVTMEGNILEASVDIRFLIEALGALDEKTVILTGNGPDHPIVIRPQGRTDFVHVIMPMTAR